MTLPYEMFLIMHVVNFSLVLDKAFQACSQTFDAVQQVICVLAYDAGQHVSWHARFYGFGQALTNRCRCA